MPRPEEIRSAQFVDSYFPVVDGVMRVVHNYASLMNKVSYSCVVAPKAARPFDDASLPYDVFRTPALCLNAWQYSVALPGDLRTSRRLASEARPDIIHVHSPFTQRGCAVRLAKELHIPLVATFHTKYYDDIYRITRNAAFSRAVVSNIVSFYSRCDSVWACSATTAETLHEYGYKGDIVIMNNGTDFRMPEDPAKAAEFAAAEYGIDLSSINLLFVGTQVWQKNLRLVMDTMKLVCEKQNSIHLWVAGSGYDSEAIISYARSLGLGEDTVHFLGRVDDHDLLSGLFLNADLLFFPSVYDNSPLVVREAAALGTPSLLTKGSNSADIIDPDINGFIAEENPQAMCEKILSVADSKDLLATAGRNARNTIPVSWESLIPSVYEEYSRIIESYRS